MANEEQLEILKHGVEVWNKWRRENPDKEIDLAGADLSRAELLDVNLNDANLSKANFSEADLTLANLINSNLIFANLSQADLRIADLSGAILIEADLSMANIKGGSLKEADLSGVDLYETDLSGVDLTNAGFKFAKIRGTIFGNNVLNNIIDLDATIHSGPSFISTETLHMSKGKIPAKFLRGCGLSDWEIEAAELYNPELSNEDINQTLYKIYNLRAQQPLQISPLFISYSHADSAFVEKIEEHLNAKGIRFWRDVHHATSGRLEKQIDRAIRHNPTVLVVLSENSIKSDWVEHEVRTARKLEQELERDVLCPLALDDSWKESPWPKRVMEQVLEYNILDFSGWKDDVKFGMLFKRLIDGLELFYK